MNVSKLILLLLGICLAILPCKAQPKTVGVSLPLTGPVAQVGISTRNAILLADSEFDLGNKVNFIFEDDQYIPRNSVSAVQKFVSKDHVEGLIVFGSGESLAVADIAENRHIPMISISTSLEVTKNRNYVMRHWLDSGVEARKLVSEVSRRGYRSLAVVTAQQDAMLAIRNDFSALSPAKIVFSSEVGPDDDTLREVAIKIKAADPQAVLLILVPPQTGLLARRLREIKYPGDLFSVHTLEADQEFRRPDNVLIGAWFVSCDERAAAGMFDRYRAMYHQEPMVGASNGFDIAKLFIQALATSDPNGYLHTVKDFEGALGHYGANEHSGFNVAAIVKEITPAGLKYAE